MAYNLNNIGSLLSNKATKTVAKATSTKKTTTSKNNQKGAAAATQDVRGAAHVGGNNFLQRAIDTSVNTAKAVSSLQPSNTSTTTYGGGYGGGYGGYGGGGGSTGPTDEMKEIGQALKGVAGLQAQATKDKFNNAKDAMNKANANAKATMEKTGHLIGRQSSAEWYHNALENPQKAFSALRDRSGTAMNGSMRLSMMDDMQRVFDDQTVAAITNELQQKNDNIYEYIQTVNKNINDLNKLAADTESSLAQGAADYVTQLLNIHPDLVNGKEKGFDKLVDTSIFKTGGKAKTSATNKEKTVAKATKAVKTAANAKATATMTNKGKSVAQAAKAVKTAADAKTKTTKNLSTAQAASAVKIPSYLSYSGFYNKNKQNLVTPNYLAQVRPANARDNARKINTTSRGNVASAANPDYLNALTTPYGQRRY